MKVVLAPNAFKECLSAPIVAKAMAEGVLKACPDAEIRIVPLADGGDGACEALVSARNGVYREINVSDPLLRPIYVQYGLIDEGKTAVMEMAAASGLWILAEDEKDPMHTSTLGTGEMIRDALEQGVETIILGIGGSATVDGGTGMAAALGFRFLDKQGREIIPDGKGMKDICTIDASRVHPCLYQVKILVACDVTNPLLGPQGAVAVYAPQKGATPETMPVLEEGLVNVAERWKEFLQISAANTPGAGAAGGLGAGLLAFCRAELCSGFDLIANYARLDEALDGADLVLTGEGKMDASTSFGKVPVGVARRARKKNVPAVGVAGSLAGDLANLYEEGFLALFGLPTMPMSLDESMRNAYNLLVFSSEQIIRLRM